MGKKKGEKALNPTDQFRKLLRKKEKERNREDRKKSREERIKKLDPSKLKEEVEKYRNLQRRGLLDKGGIEKKEKLEKEYEKVTEYRKNAPAEQPNSGSKPNEPYYHPIFGKQYPAGAKKN